MAALAFTTVDRWPGGRRVALAAMTAVVMIVIVMTWGSESAAVQDPIPVVATDDRPAPVLETTIIEESGASSTESVADPAAGAGVESELAAEVVATPVIVPNPGNGDLRVDASADVLPLDYAPTAPAAAILDVAYGSEPAQRLDLYLPNQSNAPVVVFLHSGGWVAGDKQNVPPMVLRFIERGYAVASVGYRLAPEHTFPAPVHDVKLAIRWLKAHGASDGSIDGDHMVIYGTSAGGHIASFVAATPGSYEPEVLDPDLAAFDSTVVGVVSAVGPVDLVTFYRHDNEWAEGFTEAFVGCRPCSLEELADASPISHLHPDLPPAYFAYGPEDTLVRADDQGTAIATAWAAATGDDSAWLDLVDGQGHNLAGNTINQRSVEAFIDFAVAADDQV